MWTAPSPGTPAPAACRRSAGCRHGRCGWHRPPWRARGSAPCGPGVLRRSARTAAPSRSPAAPGRGAGPRSRPAGARRWRRGWAHRSSPGRGFDDSTPSSSLLRRPFTRAAGLRKSVDRGLAETITPGMYGTLIRFAAYTALRAGEIGALRLGRVDLLRGRVEVAESLADVGGHLEFGPTKTTLAGTSRCRRSYGTSSANTSRSVPGHQGPCLLCSTWRAPSPRPVLQALLQAGRRRRRPPEQLRFHDLRHTYAASCIASTADPYAVMRRMGHSSITVTYNTYGDLLP